MLCIGGTVSSLFQTSCCMQAAVLLTAQTQTMHRLAMQGDSEASKSGAVLLTKDNNMSLKAEANNLKAITPAHFPAAQPDLHKKLLSISSDTSPVKHSPPPQAPSSPGSPPRRPRALSMDPPEQLASLTASSAHSQLTQSQSADASGSGKAEEAAHALLWPGGQDRPLRDTSTSAAISRLLSAANQDHAADQLSQMHLLQQPSEQQLQQQQQQQLQQSALPSGSLFRLQGSPMVHPGMVTGSHGHPQAPVIHPTPLPQTVVDAPGAQQSHIWSSSGGQAGMGNMHGSMQHQQGGFPGLYYILHTT